MGRSPCITSARFQMVCDIISPHSAPAPENQSGGEGHWQWEQDAESGSIIQVWVKDDPSTESIEGTVIKDVRLFAEGVLDGGLRVAGSTERFAQIYENVDWVMAVFPKDTRITKRDQVHNIRNARSGEVLWVEDEITGTPPTLFEVMGVTPVLFLGKVIEKSVMLKRAEVQ